MYRFMFKNVVINFNQESSFIRVGIMTQNGHWKLQDSRGYIGTDTESLCWSYYNARHRNVHLYMMYDCHTN